MGLGWLPDEMANISLQHITSYCCFCYRCNLWGDLAKVARKNFVWDVALVAASFCVQFDGDVSMDTENSSEY